MKALVTGATGKVGNAVARALVERGDAVRVLARSPEKARAVLPAEVEVVRGDVTEPATVAEAVAGVDVVFNAVGLPEQWTADPGIFERVNARGSETVARAAREAGVPRFVHTSTIDVFHADTGGRFDESRVADYPKGTLYERSKQLAEELVLAQRAPGFEVVCVNPCAVYGPGPAASVSIDGDLFKPLIEGKLPALTPGGFGVVYTDGVARGHLLAAERGRDGERYILCDRHVTLRELAQAVVRTAHKGRVPPTLPVPLARTLAAVGEAVSRRTGTPPLLPSGTLTFFLWNAKPDSTKAQEELGWEPTLLEDGLSRAIAAL